MRKILFIVLVLIFSSCATYKQYTPGNLSESKSDFDGLTTIDLSRGNLDQGLTPDFGAEMQWNQDQELGGEGIYFLTLTRFGVIKNINKVDFKVDGKNFDFEAVGVTDINTTVMANTAHSNSKQIFRVSQGFLDALAKAKNVGMRVTGTTNIMDVKVDTSGGSWSFVKHLPKFLARVDQVKNK